MKSNIKKIPKKAVGPKLRVLLNVLFVLFAILVINSVYLGAITFAEWLNDKSYQNHTYLIMFLMHLALGLVIIVPLIIYGVVHIGNTHHRPNKRAIKAGYALFISCLVLLLSGLLLTRGIPFVEIKNTELRNWVYWLHVLVPLIAIWLFIMHRLAGPRLKWKPMIITSVATFLTLGVMFFMQSEQFLNKQKELPETNPLFEPSLSQTATQGYYQPHELDNNAYCQECHQDVHDGWLNSVHKVSSFNNPSYTFSINAARKFLQERDGNHDAARFCAACHDPILLFSGEFDKDVDFSHSELGSAGISCTSCHAISKINSVKGNGAFTIDIPEPYPFTDETAPFLKWVNRTLIKAKPEFHKDSYLKPLHKTTEFCSVCHKVSIPEELNNYKWLRGQNHYDSFNLSGVSGHSVTSFYYPPEAKQNCQSCHMPLVESDDFGAIPTSDSTTKVHSHFFEAANSGIRYLNGLKSDPNNNLLQGALKVEMFGLREDGNINGKLVAPIKNQNIEIQSGKTYLLETFVRTLTLGHAFTQGTVDSNQVWVELNVHKGGELLFQNGGLNAQGEVDKWSFFINAYVLDKHGNRIALRDVENIFTALYNHNIPPGAAATIHYELAIPKELQGQIDLQARVLYRKFDTEYYKAFTGQDHAYNDLPIIVMAEDMVSLNVVSGSEGSESLEGLDAPAAPTAASSISSQNLSEGSWINWNDYGIGLLRNKAFKQAEQAFKKVADMGHPEGWVNLTRVYLQQGLLVEAQQAINKAAEFKDFKYPWQLTYFSAVIDLQNGFLKQAVNKFEAVYNTEFQAAQRANFDFSNDFRFVTMYAQAMFQLSKTLRGHEQKEAQTKALDLFKDVLQRDPEWADAHFGLFQLYNALGEKDKAAAHKTLHAKYKVDDNAKDRVISLAKAKDKAAEEASEDIAIYKLRGLDGFISTKQYIQDNKIQQR